MSCIVPICTMNSIPNSLKKRSFHGLPVDRRVLDQWYKVIPRGRNSWTKYSRICSIHFTKDSFKHFGFKKKGKWKRLKPNAVPSLFLGLKTTDLTAPKDQQERSKDLRVAKLAKCGWLGLAVGKKSFKPSILKPQSTPEVPLEKEQALNITITNTEVKEKSTNVKTEYGCPFCTKVFKMYFMALRHIKKYHCINHEEKSVSPNLSDEAKPVLLEYCLTCSTHVVEPHECSTFHHQDQHSKLNRADQHSSHNFTCLGCGHQFHSFHPFEGHIEREHADALGKYLFPDDSVYTLWRKDMETYSDVKYLALSRNIYYCSYVSSGESTVLVCPSSLSVQRDTKGVHVTFYKRHYGHLCKEYIVPDRFEIFFVTSLMEGVDSNKQNSEDNVPPGEESEIILVEKNYDTMVTVKDSTSHSRRKLAHTVRMEENPIPNLSLKTSQSPKLLEDLYVDIVDENLELLAERVTLSAKSRWRPMRKVPIIKTKIGTKWINKHKVDNIEQEVKLNIKFTHLPKVKVDLEYEVQERDDDCNILILKI